MIARPARLIGLGIGALCYTGRDASEAIIRLSSRCSMIQRSMLTIGRSRARLQPKTPCSDNGTLYSSDRGQRRRQRKPEPRRGDAFRGAGGTAARERNMQVGDAGAGSGEVLLSARGLRKSFGGFLAVDGVDLRIPQGTVHAPVGPNGAG